jgi:hypothetical protein
MLTANTNFYRDSFSNFLTEMQSVTSSLMCGCFLQTNSKTVIPTIVFRTRFNTISWPLGDRKMDNVKEPSNSKSFFATLITRYINKLHVVRNCVFISLFSSLGKKMKVFLCDLHVICVSSLSMFQWLNQCLWNLVCVSWHLSPSQRHKGKVKSSLCFVKHNAGLVKTLPLQRRHTQQ